MKRSGEPTVIYHAASTQQAALLKNLLEERGITAWVDNDVIQSAAGGLPLGWTSDARVLVQENDAAEARQFALEFDARASQGYAAPQADEPDEAPLDVWTEWPQCPQCGEQRHTRCPLCGGAGTDFPLVDLEETERGQRVLLLCRDCDEHFRPTFFRVCHRCGYDFGDGIYAGPMSAVRAEGVDSTRLWMVIAALCGVMLLVGAYFGWLLRG